MSCSTIRRAAVVVSVPVLVTTGLGHQRGDGSDVGRSVLSHRSQHVPLGQDGLSARRHRSRRASLRRGRAFARPYLPATLLETCPTPLAASARLLALSCLPPTPGWVSPSASLPARAGGGAPVCSSLLGFMERTVYPGERRFLEEVQASGDPYRRPPVMEDLQSEARRLGLWNSSSLTPAGAPG